MKRGRYTTPIHFEEAGQTTGLALLVIFRPNGSDKIRDAHSRLWHMYGYHPIVFLNIVLLTSIG